MNNTVFIILSNFIDLLWSYRFLFQKHWDQLLRLRNIKFQRIMTTIRMYIYIYIYIMLQILCVTAHENLHRSFVGITISWNYPGIVRPSITATTISNMNCQRYYPLVDASYFLVSWIRTEARGRSLYEYVFIDVQKVQTVVYEILFASNCV